MMSYPKSPKEMTGGMMYFPRMLDKIRLHARGELSEDYHKNLGAVKAADGACCKAALMRKFWSGVSKKGGGSMRATS